MRCPSTVPINGPDTVDDVAGSMMLRLPADEYPYPIEFTMPRVMQPDCDFGKEYGLSLVLDALADSAAKASHLPS